MPRSITQPPPDERRVVEPRLVRAVGVVEDEVDGVDLAELAAGDELARPRARRRVAVGEVDAEQPVGRARRLDDARASRRRRGRAASGRTRRGRARAPRSPARRAARSAWRSRPRRGRASSSSSSERAARRGERRIGDRRDLRDRDGAALDRARSRVPADPADAEEPEPRPRRDALTGSHARAFTKPSGRVARELERRRRARRAGSVCVTSGAGSSRPARDQRRPPRASPSTYDARVALVRVDDVEAAPVPALQVDLRGPSWW